MANKVIDSREFFASWETVSQSYHAQIGQYCTCQSLKDSQTAKLFPEPSAVALNCVVSISALNQTIEEV